MHPLPRWFHGLCLTFILSGLAHLTSMLKSACHSSAISIRRKWEPHQAGHKLFRLKRRSFMSLLKQSAKRGLILTPTILYFLLVCFREMTKNCALVKHLQNCSNTYKSQSPHNKWFCLQIGLAMNCYCTLLLLLVLWTGITFGHGCCCCLGREMQRMNFFHPEHMAQFDSWRSRYVMWVQLWWYQCIIIFTRTTYYM